MKINIQPSLQTPFKNFFPNISDNSEIQKFIVPIYQREYDWEELGSKDNSSFGNLRVNEKIKKSSDYKNDAFISHIICQSLDLESQVNEGPYDKNNFKLLRSTKNLEDKVPTEYFFENRKEFYRNELVEMIFNSDKFILNSCSY